MGHYKDATMKRCTQCNDNTYSPNTGTETCLPCDGTVSADRTQCSSEKTGQSIDKFIEEINCSDTLWELGNREQASSANIMNVQHSACNASFKLLNTV